MAEEIRLLLSSLSADRINPLLQENSKYGRKETSRPLCEGEYDKAS